MFVAMYPGYNQMRLQQEDKVPSGPKNQSDVSVKGQLKELPHLYSQTTFAVYNTE